MKKIESEVNQSLKQYHQLLSKQKNEVTDALMKWREECIKQIEDHVDEQKKYLEKYFETYEKFLENKCQECLTETQKLKKKNQDDRIKQLITECQVLEHIVAKLDKCEQSITFMNVVTEEQSQLKQQENSQTSKFQDKQLEAKSTEDMNNFALSSIAASSNSSTEQRASSARKTA